MKKAIICFLGMSILLMPIQAINAQELSSQEESIYYILIDRFTNGNSANDYKIDINNPKAYHGGDIQGVTSKLPYIKQLGFTTINLSPVMSNSPEGYHGFLIDDFTKIEENLGSMEDLRTLVQKAHDLDIRVLIDFPITHIAPNHPWTSQQQAWLNGKVNKVWGEGLPAPALENPKVASNYLDTAVFWMKETGIDGYRLYIDEQTPASFVESFTSQVHAIDSKSLVIVEETEVSNLKLVEGARVVHLDNELKELAVSTFSEAGNSLQNLLQLTESHATTNYAIYMDKLDTTRFTREVVKQAQNPTTRWKLALTYLYTVPGIPVVYQGTEVPMDNGVDAPDHRMAQLNSGEDELKQYIEQLAAIKKQFPALSYGSMELVDRNGAMSLYKRIYQGDSVYVAINNDVETKTITISELPEGMQLTGLIHDNIVRKQPNGEFKIALDRETADVFIIEQNTGLNWLFIGFMVLVFGGFVVSILILSKRGKK